ncbi:MAG: septum site-determining protein MinC [Vulcanococcus sp.]
MQAPSIRLQLSSERRAQATALEEIQHQLGAIQGSGSAVLCSADRCLTLPELRQITSLLAEAGIALRRVEATRAISLVPAAALGLETALAGESTSDEPPAEASSASGLCVHRSTLRSGDHLQVEGSVLVRGDVNPGARVSAGGDVRVWGRLRGVAHAGKDGNTAARIVAMQLRPLQLRIADAVARGPEDLPPPGFCEEALLLNGAIEIRPAEPIWPQELNAA